MENRPLNDRDAAKRLGRILPGGVVCIADSKRSPKGAFESLGGLVSGSVARMVSWCAAFGNDARNIGVGGDPSHSIGSIAGH